MADPFRNVAPTLESVGFRHFEITPDDDNDLEIIPRAIRVGGAGDIVVADADATDVTYSVTAGEVLLFRPIRIKATGTTATNIVGWY